MSTDDLSIWKDARRLADELEVEAYFASMETRDRWHRLELRYCRLAKTIAHPDVHVDRALLHELHDVRDALRALCDHVYRTQRMTW